MLETLALTQIRSALQHRYESPVGDVCHTSKGSPHVAVYRAIPQGRFRPRWNVGAISDESRSRAQGCFRL